MTDLEARLRADAAQIGAPPDFDAAVTKATAHRPRSHAWLAAAAVVLLIAGGSAALSLRDEQSNGPQTAASSTIKLAPTGPSVVGAIVAPEPSSSRELALIIRQPGTTSSTCPRSQTKVTELPTEVHVKLSKPSAPSLEPGSCFITFRTEDGVAAGRQRLNLTPTWGADYRLYLPRLNRPLGTRSLIDDATGQRIEVLKVRPPSPGQVPDGYAVKPIPDNPMSSVWLNFQPGALAPLAVQRTYTNAAGDRIVLVKSASAHVTPGAKIIDHAVIHGHNATITQSPQTRCVTWAPTTSSGFQVCSDISQARPAASSTDLVSETDLLRTANSVH